MDKSRINYICKRYLEDTATASELEELEMFFSDSKYDEELRNILAESYYTMPVDLIVDKSESDVKRNSLDLILSFPQRKKTVTLWTKYAAAAVLFVIVGSALFYYRQSTKSISTEQTASTEKVIPGTTGATLTLSDGTEISLHNADKGIVAKEAGITITKGANGAIIYQGSNSNGKHLINTVSIKRGQTYQLVLPDGSKVWLNAESKLSYTAALTQNGKRKVELSGEAYFEVAKRPNEPFIVVSNNQTVQVIGTHFNVSAYADDEVGTTTLLEGSVKINGTILKPNDQASQVLGNIRVQKVDTRKAVAWKNGVFMYKNDPLEDIMKKISRWYDVEVYFQDGALKTKTFSGSLSRYSNVEDFLEILKFAGINSKLEKKKIYIIK